MTRTTTTKPAGIFGVSLGCDPSFPTAVLVYPCIPIRPIAMISSFASLCTIQWIMDELS
jgi:hypothetical protein